MHVVFRFGRAAFGRLSLQKKTSNFTVNRSLFLADRSRLSDAATVTVIAIFPEWDRKRRRRSASVSNFPDELDAL